jgi:CheY-like chemotaxis protein
MTTRPFSIIILEDSRELQMAYRRAFDDEMPGCVLHVAEGVREGIELLRRHPEVDAIVVDGELAHGDLGSSFVYAVRASYRGLMVANSSSTSMNALMREAGCTEDTRGSKYMAPRLVRARLEAIHR